MTIEHDDVEQVLGPLRSANRPLWMNDIPGNLFTSSKEHPICDWLRDNSQDVTLGFSERLESDREAAFAWLQEQPSAHDIMTPCAFLAFSECVPVLAPGYRWSLILHQVAGVACNHRPFVGLRLRMRKSVSEAAKAMAQHWWGTDLGRGYPTLEQLEIYRAQLRNIGLDANRAYRWLSEGFYSADFTQEAIDLIAVDAPRPENLIADQSDLATAKSRAIVAIAAPNSD